MAEETSTQSASNGSPTRRRVVVGVLFIVFGIVLTLGELGYGYFEAWHWWPLIIIGLGLARLVEAGDWHRRRSAMWLVVIGTWLGISEWTVLDYHRSWPLLLVGVGAMMAWDAVTGPRPAGRRPVSGPKPPQGDLR